MSDELHGVLDELARYAVYSVVGEMPASQYALALGYVSVTCTALTAALRVLAHAAVDSPDKVAEVAAVRAMMQGALDLLVKGPGE